MYFECKPCAAGCDTCEDGSPCILALDWMTRSLLLGISCLIMCCVPLLVWFTVQFRDIKVSMLIYFFFDVFVIKK